MCRGVICLLKVVDGEVRKGDRITAAFNGEHHDVLEVRSLHIELQRVWHSVHYKHDGMTSILSKLAFSPRKIFPLHSLCMYGSEIISKTGREAAHMYPCLLLKIVGALKVNDKICEEIAPHIAYQGLCLFPSGRPTGARALFHRQVVRRAGGVCHHRHEDHQECTNRRHLASLQAARRGLARLQALQKHGLCW